MAEKCLEKLDAASLLIKTFYCPHPLSKSAASRFELCVYSARKFTVSIDATLVLLGQKVGVLYTLLKQGGRGL